MTAYLEALKKIECNFPRVLAVLEDCMVDAEKHLSPAGIEAYIEGACAIYKTGRGEEPVLVYLEETVQVAAQLGEGVISEIVEFTRKLAKIDREHICVDDLDLADIGAACLDPWYQIAIKLDYSEFAGLAQDRQGDRAITGTDLDNALAGPRIDSLDNARDDFLIAQEVLAEALAHDMGRIGESFGVSGHGSR